ncbi:MAG: SMC-Scp complex subunit ScpB [Chthoniobacterales bacterium]|nr:SMC-Scp complex subunit ScpB [Chthoniobacterales bacterium]
MDVSANSSNGFNAQCSVFFQQDVSEERELEQRLPANPSEQEENSLHHGIRKTTEFFENLDIQIHKVIEALVFFSPSALTVEGILGILETAAKMEPGKPYLQEFAKISKENIHNLLVQISEKYDREGAPSCLVETASGWKFVSRPEYAPWLRAMLSTEERPVRLSTPALETLAIIAYRQPISRAEIEAVRGVSCEKVLQNLLERGLIHISGRSDGPGRPLLYATTSLFLEHFGIRSLEELPNCHEFRTSLRNYDIQLQKNQIDEVRLQGGSPTHLEHTSPETSQEAVVTELRRNDPRTGVQEVAGEDKLPAKPKPAVAKQFDQCDSISSVLGRDSLTSTEGIEDPMGGEEKRNGPLGDT